MCCTTCNIIIIIYRNAYGHQLSTNAINLSNPKQCRAIIIIVYYNNVMYHWLEHVKNLPIPLSLLLLLSYWSIIIARVLNFFSRKNKMLYMSLNGALVEWANSFVETKRNIIVNRHSVWTTETAIKNLLMV